MLSFARVAMRHSFVARRLYSTVTVESSSDLRTQMLNEVKAAMKKRDTNTSMTLRSVLSEINSAEKAAKDGLSASATASIVRKAIQRRSEAATQFIQANRPELAEKEQKEVELLSAFLPPLLSAADIDVHIKAILETLPAGTDPRKASGFVFKEFYARVDKSAVDSNLVKERTQALLNPSA